MLCKVKNAEKSDPKSYEVKHPELEYALYLYFSIFIYIRKKKKKKSFRYCELF